MARSRHEPCVASRRRIFLQRFCTVAPAAGNTSGLQRSRRSDKPGSDRTFIECARNLESATDALMHTALHLRDAVLGELVVQ